MLSATDNLSSFVATNSKVQDRRPCCGHLRSTLTIIIIIILITLGVVMSNAFVWDHHHPALMMKPDLKLAKYKPDTPSSHSLILCVIANIR